MFFRRGVFCLFHHFFSYVSGLGDGWVKLPSFIIDELRCAALHSPIATANIRTEPSPEMLATDATPTKACAAVCNAPREIAAAVYRAAEGRGSHMRLDRGSQPEREERLLPKSSEMDLLLQNLQWNTLSELCFRVLGI